MPTTAFNAIKGSLSSFLGGAQVELLELKSNTHLAETDDSKEMFIPFEVEKVAYAFRAKRHEIDFTAMERDFIGELLAAFKGLLTGFSAKGYVAHFRTALLTSLTDIAVARFVRGSHKGAFWPIQSLIQLLKSLSYERYEGSQATTGFLVYRNHMDDFLKALPATRYEWLDFGADRQKISRDFFQNPLSYRFVDGYRALYLSDISMNLKGAIRTTAPGSQDNIEHLSNRETISLLSKSGDFSFAVYVNKSSEVEVVLDTDKLLIWRKGVWTIFDPDIMRQFLYGSLEKRSTDHLIWSIYALSKSRHGTVVLVANDDSNLKALRMGHVGGHDPLSRTLIKHIRGTKIGTLKRSGELSRILSSDGLTIINRKGELIDTGVIIDTSKVKDLVTGGGRTTAAIAASFYGQVIKISEDGPIDFFRNGKSLYRFG